MAMDFRLLDPNAASRGVDQVNAWADAAARRRAGSMIGTDPAAARQVLNANGLLGDAMNVQQGEWATENREIAATQRTRDEEDRQRGIALEEEKREAEVLGGMATNLQAVLTEFGPEAVLPAFDSLAASWRAKGANPEEIAQMRAGLEANPEQFLMATAGAVSEANQRYQMWQQGGSVGTYDRRTGNIEERFRAERFEEFDPTKNVYRVPGMGGASGPAPAPAGRGPAAVPAEAEALVGNRDAVVRMMIAEARGEGAQGLQAVGAVIVNRARQTGKTADQIIAEQGQFEPAMTEAGRARMARVNPNSTEYAMASAALDRVLAGEDPTGGADHFYAPRAQAALGRNAPSWDNGSGADIGNHRFFRLGYGGQPGSAPAPSAPPQEAPAGLEVVQRGVPRAPTGQAAARFRPITEQERVQYNLPEGASAQINETTGQLQVLGGAGGPRTGQPGGQLAPQDRSYLNTIKNEAKLGAGAANIYAQMRPLAMSVDTGGFMAMPGAGEVVGAMDAETRRFMQLTDQLTPGMRQGLPGAASDRDVAMFRSATPSIDKRREANIAAIDAGEAWAARQGDYVAFMEQWARDNGSLLGASEEWSRYTSANPLFENADGTHGMPTLARVQPWRQWFGRPRAAGSGNRPAPAAGATPAPAGGGRRRVWNAQTQRLE